MAKLQGVSGLAVVAIGGNSLLRDERDVSVAAERETLKETAAQLAEMVADGWRLVVTHGNGPQVGFNLLRAELAAKAGLLPRLPLDVLGAQTQGSIGYLIQEGLERAFFRPGVRRPVAVVVTRVVVDPNDPAFHEPTKPVGPFYTEEEARRLEREEGWRMARQSQGWRRVVPSPAPLEILELGAIRVLLQEGYIVVCAGGGGIPVVPEPDGTYRGVEAVVDKDLSSALLAEAFDVDLFLISTGVERVAVHFGTPQQRWLDQVDASELEGYLRQGHFPPGSMGPKVQAVLRYLRAGGRRAAIAAPHALAAAARGEAGTQVVP
ncbi:MAG: carbamate kinase [Armatimonadota bacterium]|nr:carbamate kinase [Armatimonadota bacterium]MDW8157188.1 carbamate kinase [Armatimonadota bacterium]